MARMFRQMFVGMGRLFDFSGASDESVMRGVRARRKERPHDAREAFQADWANVGSDLRKAMNVYREKHG